MKIVKCDFFEGNVVEQVIMTSKRNRKLLREEFNKMAKYYTDNPDEYRKMLLEMNENLEVTDHISEELKNKTENSLNNFDNITWKFEEKYLIDSHKKIYAQVREIPDDVKKEEEEVKVIFYAISNEPSNTGSRLILSAIVLNWRMYCSVYFGMMN